LYFCHSFIAGCPSVGIRSAAKNLQERQLATRDGVKCRGLAQPGSAILQLVMRSPSAIISRSRRCSIEPSFPRVCGLGMLGHRLPSATSNPHRTAPLRLCSWKSDRFWRRLPPVSTILISIHDAADFFNACTNCLTQGLAFFCLPFVLGSASTSQAISPKPSHCKIMAWFAFLVCSS
jgi:hypothetical protein